MARPRVLYVSHAHPSVRPGGAHQYALELYEGMRDFGEFEPILLARNGPPLTVAGPPHAGSPIGRANNDPRQFFCYTDVSQWDGLNMTVRHKELYTRTLRDFLQAYRPDVVHFQHTLWLGYDLLREARQTLPDAPLIYTLHEYLPICHSEGLLLRTMNRQPCLEESPRRCNECFPHIPPQSFFLRKRFAQSHLSLVDRFVAPSRFLLERYVDWGIPREKIVYEEYGRLDTERRAATSPAEKPNRFGFFGQIRPAKGLQVLLQAMQLLEDEDVQLRVHGANLDMEAGAFQEEIRSLLKRCGPNVEMVGSYRQEDLPALMAAIDWVVVPSIWWENSPLVIQEAFVHGKPVICSDIGGMAEKVVDGVSGLHFRAADAVSLAETIRRAAESPHLRSSLQAGIPPVYSIRESVGVLSRLYRCLLEGAVPAGATR